MMMAKSNDDGEGEGVQGGKRVVARERTGSRSCRIRTLISPTPCARTEITVRNTSKTTFPLLYITAVVEAGLDEINLYNQVVQICPQAAPRTVCVPSCGDTHRSLQWASPPRWAQVLKTGSQWEPPTHSPPVVILQVQYDNNRPETCHHPRH